MTHAEKILARGAEKALESVEEKGPDWLSKAIEKAEAKALDVWPDDGSGKVDPRRSVALAALEPLKDQSVKEALSRQGRDRLERLLIRVGAGEDLASATYEALEAASADELLAALDASTAKAVGRTAQRLADREVVLETLKKIGAVALKLLVPLLLAAL